MVIFLYGSDTYRSFQKFQEIVEYYKKVHKSGLNLKYFDKIVDFRNFKNEIQQSPMFKEKKLVILKDSLLSSEFKQKFLAEGQNFIDSKDIFLVYLKRKISEKDSFFKFLKKYGKSQEFELLKGEELKKWVKKEVGKYQLKIESRALKLLIRNVGNNLWQMQNEIKKLINYKKGQKVELEDVELLVRPKIEPDIFKTIDAIALKNRKQALELLHQHLKKGDNPLYLLSMINFQFRNLLTVRALSESTNYYPNLQMNSLSKKLGMHPYVARKSIQQAKKFSFEEIKKIYQKIFQTDLKIKTGQLNPEIALDMLITGI